MGTKNDPGKFDCYANAEPDEPMFVLLGRDPMAGLLVRIWATLRASQGEAMDKCVEAMQCAEAMEGWARSRGKRPLTGHIEATNKIIKASTERAVSELWAKIAQLQGQMVRAKLDEANKKAKTAPRWPPSSGSSGRRAARRRTPATRRSTGSG